MKILFERKFHKDIETLTDRKLKLKIEQIINSLEQTDNINYIPHIKKLKGHRSAYRIRIMNYRLGFFYENNILVFCRFMNRKDIYKYFP